jgi:hypothetical protein
MENLFKAMDTHGMHVRNDGRNALQDVTVYGDPSSGPAEVSIIRSRELLFTSNFSSLFRP